MATLFDSQLQDGGVDGLNARADNLNLILVGEFLPHGGVSQVGLPALKHVAGLKNSAGRRITAVALSRLHSARSGVTAAEQIRRRAASMIASSYRAEIK